MTSLPPKLKSANIKSFIVDISRCGLWVVAAVFGDLCLCGRWKQQFPCDYAMNRAFTLEK